MKDELEEIAKPQRLAIAAAGSVSFVFAVEQPAELLDLEIKAIDVHALAVQALRVDGESLVCGDAVPAAMFGAGGLAGVYLDPKKRLLITIQNHSASHDLVEIKPKGRFL